MRKLILIGLAVVTSGCAGREYEYSAPMVEHGKVADLIFVPSGYGSDVAVGVNTGKGGGVTVTPVNVAIPERYGIVFECEHGTFAVEGDKWIPLWKRLKVGQEVEIRYRDVFEVDPKTRRRKHADLDFLGATVVTNDSRRP